MGVCWSDEANKGHYEVAQGATGAPRGLCSCLHYHTLDSDGHHVQGKASNNENTACSSVAKFQLACETILSHVQSFHPHKGNLATERTDKP